MKVKYSLDPIDKSMMLLGPTPADELVLSWRPEALAILEELKFDGTVYVPEMSDWKPREHTQERREWEWEVVNTCTVAVFWVPRDLEHMPGFITNVEFGMLIQSGKVVIGYPEDAPKMDYFKSLADRYRIPVYHTLRETLEAAVIKSANPGNNP